MAGSKTQKNVGPKRVRSGTFIATRPGGRSSGRSSLEGCLEALFAAYARHFLAGEPPLPRFDARLEGASVCLEIHAPDGPQLVRRRASAYLLLAGQLWGACRAPAERAALPALITSLTSHPQGDGNAWINASAFVADAETGRALSTLAELVAADAPDEAVLLLRRFLDVDRGTSPHPAAFERLASPLPARITAQSAAGTFALRAGSLGPVALAKALRPLAISPDETERLAAATCLAAVVHHVEDADNLRFLAEAQPSLSAWLDEGDGAVFETALGMAQELGTKLLYRSAYAETKSLLDPVIAQHVALTKTLRARWECRLYMGDPLADEDLDRAATLDSPDDAAYLGPLTFWSGDVAARTIAGLTRVAAALLSKAEGLDPCPDRSPRRQPLPPFAADRAAFLARARKLADEALSLGASRAEEMLARAHVDGSARDRGLQADCRGVRAMIHEAAGDHAAALADFRRARLIRIAGGLCWQSDDYGAEIRRLERTTAPVAPPCFEPTWFFDESRTKAERDAAMSSWSAQTWRTLPHTPTTDGGPIAYVLLHSVIAHGANLWRTARYDGVDLGDRIAFAAGALPYLDRWRDRRDGARLAALLTTAHLTAFLGVDTPIQEASAEERRVLYTWVQRLVEAGPLDDEAILAGLDGAPWRRICACFDERVDEYDRLRDLFDALSGAGVDAASVALVLRAYEPLLAGQPADWDIPREQWTALAEPLSSVDAARVAPVLIAWTRSGQRIPAGWGMQTLHAKWLWPLAYVWSKAHVAPFLEEVERGGLDNGKRLTRWEVSSRRACLARLRRRTDAERERGK